jgi:predicted nucleotidyltransferase
MTLVGVFFLEDHIGHKADLVTPDALKPRMRPVVEREAVSVA